MEDDLLALSAVLYNSEERIFNGVVLPSSLKILSLQLQAVAENEVREAKSAE